MVSALLLVMAAWAGPPAPATTEKAGNISALLPVANIVRGPANQVTTSAAKKGDEVIWNDLVRTDKGGRARITLLDQSILSVGSQAEMRILKHDPKSQQTSIEVNYGRVRADVTPVTKQGGSFEVKTPTAVAGVIGTVFGIDSTIGITTFLCLSGTVMVGSNDPTIPGRVPCTAGMAAVVSAGKPATTRPATQQEIQQFIQATEPAVISAMNPSSMLPGTTADVTITGTQLGNVTSVSSSSPAVTAALNPGGSASSLGVHLVVAANATPGPVTLTFTKQSGVASAAVFTILAPPQVAAGGDFKTPYLNTIEQERQSAISALNGLGVGLAQSADQGYNQISTANSALTQPMDISQAATDLKGPVNAEMNAATSDGTLVNQAAQTANTSFSNLYNTAMQALLARNPGGAPDNQFQTDLTNAFNQVNATMLAAFAAAQSDLGQQVTTQNSSIQTITQGWLAKITQTQQAQAPPSVRSISTNASPTTGGVQVTITGNNFDPNTKVLFGGVPASNVTVVSPNQITVTTPPENPGTVDLTVVSGSGQTVTMSGSFSFGGPVAAINPTDVTANPAAPVNLDGSRSSDTLAGATLTYSWTLCSLGFKPPQLNASLPAMNAGICTAAPGTLTTTDSLFTTTAPTTPGQYFARLQVTDNMGLSSVIYSSVNVVQASYDDPLTRENSFVATFTSLQPSSLSNFFDASFPNLVGFEASLQAAFATYQSMVVNLQGALVSTSGNLSTVVANWQLVYTIKNDPTCNNAPPGCQVPTYKTNIGSVTTVWTLNPAKGWFVSDLRFPNGFPQATLPAIPPVNTAQPDLQLVSVSGSVAGNPIPVGTGAQTFFATVKNIGTAASLPTQVQFVLINPATGTQLAASNPNPIAQTLGTAGSGNDTVQVSATLTIDPAVVTQVTNAQLNVTVNPGCQVAESTCTNNSGTFQVVITPAAVPLPDLATQITSPASGATVPPGSLNVQATVTNLGKADFPTPATGTDVTFSLTVPGFVIIPKTVTITQPIPVNQQVAVGATLDIPVNIPVGTKGTLTVDASPTCPNPVEPNCTNNTATFTIFIGIPVPDLLTQITSPANGGALGTGAQTIQATVTNIGTAVYQPPAGGLAVNFTLSVAGNVVATNTANINASIGLNQSVPLQAMLAVPNTIPAGTPGVLTVDASAGCAGVEPNCANNIAAHNVEIGTPAIQIACMQSVNTPCPSPVQLNGPLAQVLTLSPSLGATVGSVTLTLTDDPQITSNPSQFPNVQYGSANASIFAAAISGGNVTTGPAAVIVTPSAANPPAANLLPATLYFNIGDVVLSPAPPACLQLPPGNAPVPVTFAFMPVDGFNAQNVSWQWSGLPTGVTVDNVSSTGYNLPTFTFRNSNVNTGQQTFYFAATFSDPRSGANTATKVFTFTFDLSATACPAGVMRFSMHGGAGGSVLNGSWTSGASPGGMARSSMPLKPLASPLPDLQIVAGSVSYSPSIPKPGDTVAVRFKVTNAGTANAVHVPISLVVNGTAVASDTFDLRAGGSTLAGLEWKASAPTAGSLQASVVVDPGHTIPQQSTLGKAVPLARFTLLGGTAASGALATAAQRATLELAEGACLGFRFASGVGSSCGAADVEISVESFAGGRFILAAQNGIAEAANIFGAVRLSGLHFAPQVPAVAGRTYAVQLSGGKTGILRIMAIRNPAQMSAKSRQAFGANAPKPLGAETTGPVETGDVSGVRAQTQKNAVIEVSYQVE